MANFPGSVSSNSNLYIAVNGLQTTLAVAINAIVTTITLTSTSGFPTTGYVTIENNEVVSYTGIAGSDLTGCTRGADGTTALSHASGVVVGATIVAAHHNLLKDEIIAIETALQAGFVRGNLTAVTSKIVVTGGTNAVIGAGTTVDLGTVTLDDLSNVVVPSPSTNDLLAFNGTNWVNVTQPATSLPLTGGTMTGDIVMSNQTGIVLKEQTVNGTNSVTLRAADDVTSSYTLKFPSALGNPGNTLIDAAGNGVLSWGAGSAISQYNRFIVGTASGTYNGSTTVFDLSFNYVADGKTLQVFYNGQMLSPSNYSESSVNQVTLNTPLVAGAEIAFRSLSGGSIATVATFFREDYIVGTPSGSYSGSLTVFNLTDTYTPGSNTLGVYLDGDLQTKGATVDYVETSSSIVTFNNALVAGQKVSFMFAQATAPGGTVSPGTAGQIAQYASTGATVSGTNNPTGIASIGGTFLGMGRNRIINGDMNIDQANASTDVTVNSTAVNYSLDQFWGVGVAASGVYALAQDATGPAGFSNSLRATCTTADGTIGATDVYAVQTVLEGYNIRDFQMGSATAKTITLSFWVKSSITGIFSGAFANNGATRCYTFEYTINAANTWEYKTVTAVGEMTGTWNVSTGNGMYITWALAVGSSFQAAAGSWGTSQVFGTSNQVNFMSSNSARTWAITGVQLEIGTVATAFEYRPYSLELILCQRYYSKSYEIGTKPGTNTGNGHSSAVAAQISAAPLLRTADITFPTAMRQTPTVTVLTDTGTVGSWIWRSTAGVDTARATTVGTGNTRGFAAQQGSSASELWGFGQWIADARL